MEQGDVRRVKAWYISKRYRHELEIKGVESGDCMVLGQGDWTYMDGFSMRERVSREGIVEREHIGAKIGELLELCHPDWYHHYLSDAPACLGYGVGPGYRWGLHVEYVSGEVERWEGDCVAPERLLEAFEKLYACGMPRPPIMPDHWVLRTATKGDDQWDSLVRLSCYNQLLTQAGGLRFAETLRTDTMLILREFIDDIRRYLRRNCPEYSLDVALKIWGIEPTLAGLREVDVSQAPRMQMLTLFAALAELDNAESAAASLYRDGTIKRWSERLQALPEEEAREAKRLEREQRRAQRLAVDKAVQERITKGEEFTVRELVDETGAKASRVQSRVRTFVQRGELCAIEDTKPKRYRAA